MEDLDESGNLNILKFNSLKRIVIYLNLKECDERKKSFKKI